MARITAPREGVTETIVGVAFVDSAATTDDEAAIAYFIRQGYLVEDYEPPREPRDPRPVAAPGGLTAEQIDALIVEKTAELFEEFGGRLAAVELTLTNESPRSAEDLDETARIADEQAAKAEEAIAAAAPSTEDDGGDPEAEKIREERNRKAREKRAAEKAAQAEGSAE